MSSIDNILAFVDPSCRIEWGGRCRLGPVALPVMRLDVEGPVSGDLRYNKLHLNFLLRQIKAGIETFLQGSLRAIPQRNSAIKKLGIFQ